MPSDDLAKQELRRALRARCRSLPPETRLQDSQAAESLLLALPELAAADTVALYAATAGEANPASSLAVLLDRGVRPVFPRVAGADLEFAAIHDMDELRPGHRGIAEPAGGAIDLAEIEVIVVPGLAFDGDGVRLGQGGGHYDRTLARLSDRVLRVGFCFDFQVVERVPRGPHDQPVDLVVTDRRVIRARRGGRVPPHPDPPPRRGEGVSSRE